MLIYCEQNNVYNESTPSNDYCAFEIKFYNKTLTSISKLDQFK